MRDDESPVEVDVTLDRQVYEIGEAIRVKLRLTNRSASPVAIRQFVFDDERLAFAPPSAAHLVGPDGRDALLPYAEPATARLRDPGLSLGPHGEEWRLLPLSTFVDFKDPGRYTFWAELLDDRDRVAHGDRLHFELVDVAAAALRPSVVLSLHIVRTTLVATEPIDVEAVFANHGNAPVIILKPQEDSLSGWVNPVYRFAVIDERGRLLAPELRSGTMATPSYDATTQMAVPPGGTARVPLRLPDLPGLTTSGAYRIRLTYIVRDRAIGKGGTVLDRPMTWPAGTFVGRLESDTVTIHIR
jgi:hypothetical protein